MRLHHREVCAYANPWAGPKRYVQESVTRTHNLAGRADMLAHDEQIAVRDFLNEGGRLLYTGKMAGREYTLAEYPVPGATPEQ